MALDFFKARSNRRRRSKLSAEKVVAELSEESNREAIGGVTSTISVEQQLKEQHDGHSETTAQLPARLDLKGENLISAPATVIREPWLILRPQQPEQVSPTPGACNGNRMSTGSDLIDYFKLNAHFDATNSTTIETVQTSDRSRGLRQVTVVKKWRRMKKIGQGACGAVWLESVDGPPEDHRAVKEIAKDIHSSTLKVNYTRELLALGRLSKHQDVFVHFYGWYDNNAAIFLAMEYFEHGDLGLYINSQLTEADARLIARQLLEGLKILHAQNWAHRDLKPENIFVVRHSPDWWVKIGDFGISKRIREDETMTAIGTLKYIAPEILGYVEDDDNEYNESSSCNVAVDMWSLGCVLFQLLTLELPFANQRKLASYCRSENVFQGERLEARMVSSDAIGCVRGLLVPQPSFRLTAVAALQCPWVDIVDIKDSEVLEQNEPLDLAQVEMSLLTREDWPLKKQSIVGPSHTEQLMRQDDKEEGPKEQAEKGPDEKGHDETWQVNKEYDTKQQDQRTVDGEQSDDGIYLCKACGEILERGKAFELYGHRWHIGCFRCNSCRTLLDSDAMLLLLGDGSLICNDCTYSCSACGNKIEDLAILTGDQAFCADCFRCRNCKKKIEDLRYARTSQGIFCMPCHEALMARRRKKGKQAKRLLDQQKSSSSNDTITGNVSLPILPAIPPISTILDRDLYERFEVPNNISHEAPSTIPIPILLNTTPIYNESAQ